ncbi:class I SAM-dependent methyltransferase [Rhizobium sp. Root1220]|uniref:class I SAM-dependent methyltransferase n=1 Tax=Rhizobium sp. Root1220 TaxID=1736432 RepID=UPI0006F363D5|nr:class I SAM-dependent methyltransferase [Rhizobium sp. Root1220]KQV64542.1 methyltransferase [Rhizobium sp. Root1220]
MPDLHYEDPQLAELYDLDSGWSADRDFYLALAGSDPIHILDLGCGTGLLCDAYAARGHAVTGVDPAAAMLEVGRGKPNGQRVHWVQASAQTFRSDDRFDLIVMTGHAFQTLLDDVDVVATFATMREHLVRGGRIVFESRNPAIDWPARWNGDLVLEVGGAPVHEARRFMSMAGNRMSFELRYTFPNRKLVSKSELLFLSREEIEGWLGASGLSTETVMGDWNGQPFDPRTSPEMIFVGRHA